MHPGFIHWWKEAQRQAQAGWGANASCGPGGGGGHHGHHKQRQHDDHEAFAAGDAFSGEGGGGSFGVRRPLRFMAFKLELDEAQVEAMAAILADLKTERAQAAVDHRRSVGTFADALAGEAFDKEAATKAAHLRVTTSERLRDAVVVALEKTHKLLTAEQRKALAYLLRSGQLTI